MVRVGGNLTGLCTLVEPRSPEKLNRIRCSTSTRGKVCREEGGLHTRPEEGDLPGAAWPRLWLRVSTNGR